MAAFTYRAYRADGSSESGVVEAVDQREASRKLLLANKKPFLLKPVSGAAAAPGTANQAQPWWKLQRPVDLTKLLADLYQRP